MSHLRKATGADVEGICRVCAEAYRDTYADLLSTETTDRIIAEFYNPTRVRQHTRRAVYLLAHVA